MVRTIEGHIKAEGKTFAIIGGRFNHFVVDRLVEGAMDALIRHGGKEEDITVVRVPGAWELPMVARRLARTGKFSAIICVGAVIRGGTPHFDYVAAEVTKGIASTSLDLGVPMTLGVLTTDTIEQAIERAGTKAGNKGWDSAMAAMEMADLMDAIKDSGLED